MVFTDLRGFTAFSETAEPEEAMDVLREYHARDRTVVMAHEGTIEHFAGDGVMILFNDPIPVAEHELAAVRMALAMRDAVGALSVGWKKRGYDLGFGVGIANGYATLGAIGFEGRRDYGAIGPVTNLSARLCSRSESGTGPDLATRVRQGRGAGAGRAHGRAIAERLSARRHRVQRDGRARMNDSPRIIRP